MDPSPSVDPAIIQQYLDRMVEASSAAIGPWGVVYTSLVSVTLVAMGVAIVVLWMSLRADKKSAEGRAERERKEDREYDVKLIETLGDLAATVRGLPTQNQIVSQVLSHFLSPARPETSDSHEP